MPQPLNKSAIPTPARRTLGKRALGVYAALNVAVANKLDQSLAYLRWAT